MNVVHLTDRTIPFPSGAPRTAPPDRDAPRRCRRRFANAPIDQFRRGNRSAMTMSHKRGAQPSFGKSGCVRCHAVSGQANELFSDFEQHVIAPPQRARDETIVAYDGEGADEDFGREQVTRNLAHRYAFRTSPFCNVAMHPAFGHNGAYTRLADLIRLHRVAHQALVTYTPEAAGVAADRRTPRAPAGRCSTDGIPDSGRRGR